MKVYYTANCRTCNGFGTDAPVLYEDPGERDHETQRHADLTGHTIDIGVTIR